jgi:ubiquinone/menaquinone biosynthesis C-methylase UbiE
MNNPKSYWDTFNGFYQMGPQKHRLYALDTMAKYGVKSVLDVGCGTGPIWGILKEDLEEGYKNNTNIRWDFKYKGTDYSQGMIEVCNNNFPEADFEVEDARHLTEPDNSWDCVFLLHSLDHLDDYKAAIREATRVSKKYVCIVLWRGFTADGDNLNDRNMYGKQEGAEPWEDTYLHEYSQKSLEDEFAANHLKIVEIAEGELLNSDSSHYNFMYFLEKHDS